MILFECIDASKISEVLLRIYITTHHYQENLFNFQSFNIYLKLMMYLLRERLCKVNGPLYY